MEKNYIDFKSCTKQEDNEMDNAHETGEEGVKPELIYLNQKGEVIEEKTYDYKDLSPLEPLVEYVYEDCSKSPQVKLGDSFQECSAQDYVETEVSPEGLVLQTIAQVDGTEIESIEHSEPPLNSEVNAFRIEPMMPFFLTSPIVTIMNENNEIGETIILQIEGEKLEEQEDSQDESSIHNENSVASLQLNLCCSQDNLVINTYTCEACQMQYGCLNCLKSHYETMHIARSYVAQYKCKYSMQISKYLYCPVCELVFDNRSDTMDHYITHAVACDICGSGFDRRQYLTEHLKSAHNKGDFNAFYECELCKQVFQYGGSLSKHYQVFHKMVLCVICKMKFENSKDLQDHEKEHSEKFNILPFACSKCDKAFSDISDIAVHIRQDHSHKREVVENFGSIHKKVIDDQQRPNKRVKVKRLKSEFL
nr:zinc finger protein 271-like [Leptinotarsa decemlineata]